MLFQAKSYRFALVIAKKRKVFPGVNTLMYSVIYEFNIEKRYDCFKIRRRHCGGSILVSNFRRDCLVQ